MMHPQVLDPVNRFRTVLAECGPAGSTDPRFTWLWEVLENLVNDAGTMVLDHPDGPYLQAGREVSLYLEQLDRVREVAAGAPFTVPQSSADLLQGTGRFLIASNDLEELAAFLVQVPGIVDTLGAYLTRTQGIAAAPVAAAVELAYRSGGVYRDALTRALPVTVEYGA